MQGFHSHFYKRLNKDRDDKVAVDRIKLSAGDFGPSLALGHVSRSNRVPHLIYISDQARVKVNIICSFQQQYEFIYETIEMFLQCGVTVIKARELPYVVQQLAIKNPHTKLNGFEAEFKVGLHLRLLALRIKGVIYYVYNIPKCVSCNYLSCISQIPFSASVAATGTCPGKNRNTILLLEAAQHSLRHRKCCTSCVLHVGCASCAATMQH